MSCTTGKRALDTPRQIDARAAAADDAPDESAGAAFDAAVEEVETASRGSTPPPQSQTFGDHLAVLAARGEPIPGIGDDEILVAPADGKDDALNVEASAEAQARVQRSKKQSTIVKAETPKTPKTVAAPKRKQATAQTDSDSDSVQPKKRPKTKPQVVVLDPDSEVEEPTQSRHKSVKSSDLYKKWDQRVPDIRQRCHLLMLVRDGFPCKTSKNHQELNYRLVLQAARDIMDVVTYKRFKSDMDAAFNSTDRE